MAWLYADFETQASDALRLTVLRQHIAEVHGAIDANVSTASGSVTHDALVAKLYRLTPRLQELEARVGAVDADDRRVTSGFTRGRCL